MKKSYTETTKRTLVASVSSLRMLGQKRGPAKSVESMHILCKVLLGRENACVAHGLCITNTCLAPYVVPSVADMIE